MCFCYRFAPPIVGADAATVVAAFAVGMVANVCATEYLYSSLLVPYRHHMGSRPCSQSSQLSNDIKRSCDILQRLSHMVEYSDQRDSHDVILSGVS